jgi:hypothetical protein
MNSGRIRCPPANAIVIARRPGMCGQRCHTPEEHAGMVDLGADGDPDNR